MKKGILPDTPNHHGTPRSEADVFLLGVSHCGGELPWTSRTHWSMEQVYAYVTLVPDS